MLSNETKAAKPGPAVTKRQSVRSKLINQIRLAQTAKFKERDDLLEALHKSAIFRHLDAIEVQAGTLQLALRESERPSDLLSRQAGIIYENSKEITLQIADWLYSLGIRAEMLKPIQSKLNPS